MKWQRGDVGQISSKNMKGLFESLELRNQDTLNNLKPRGQETKTPKPRNQQLRNQ